MAPRRSKLLTCVPAIATGTVLAGTAGPTPATAAGPIPTDATAAGPTAIRARAMATTGFGFVDIPVGDVVLKANVIAPSAPGRYPAVIMLASWGLNDVAYLAPGTG
jgi:hypothetical protein